MQRHGFLGVRVIQFEPPPSAMPASASLSTLAQGQFNANVVITGTSSNGSEFFDPGAGFANHLSATVSGSGATVNSIVFTDPTHITQNVTMASGATLGSRTVSLMNPDGQSAISASGILTVPHRWIRTATGFPTGGCNSISATPPDSPGISRWPGAMRTAMACRSLTTIVLEPIRAVPRA